ncbi:helix-turn-helix domain-containing protein [Streptomyces sp. NPDC048172]|uniref:helix-turn-helix domain-containing protein n=1 Tax=Streptomyces sp. NPDC048172 TaxID=3365505 RepID=UPI00371C1285
MGSLFAELARRVADHARREVEAYAREIPEFAFLDGNPRARAEALEHAVWLRRRTLALSPGNSALGAEDLAHIASMGAARAEAGMSPEARQRVLRLHTALMLREINEATEAQRDGGVDELMRMMGWFAPQGERGIGAYSQGFAAVLCRRLPYVEQVALLARSLLAHDPLAAELAPALGMELPAHAAVTVIRVPDRPPAALPGPAALSAVEALARAHRVPVVWRPDEAGRGGELIAVGPGTPESVRLHAAPEPAPALVRDAALALGRPCAAGTATAPLAELAGALALARRISEVAPARPSSPHSRPYTLADVFVELAVADAPSVDDWLRTVARRLAPGPDLLLTLDAYYRHDMNRAAAAEALNVHPRTLDYRLRRVRELTGIAPGSTHGVRALSTVVARSLS